MDKKLNLLTFVITYARILPAIVTIHQRLGIAKAKPNSSCICLVIVLASVEPSFMTIISADAALHLKT